MKRLTFQEVESIAEREGCRFNDLFLIGDSVWVMVDAEDWRLPSKYRPLELHDAAVMSALPEVLRRLDATEFQSMAQFQSALKYNEAHTSEFEKLKYELYELLTDASRDHLPPDGGQFYLELDGAAEEDILLVCDCPESLPTSLELAIQELLRAGSYSLNWRVRASFESGAAKSRVIGKNQVNDRVESARGARPTHAER